MEHVLLVRSPRFGAGIGLFIYCCKSAAHVSSGSLDTALKGGHVGFCNYPAQKCICGMCASTGNLHMRSTVSFIYLYPPCPSKNLRPTPECCARTCRGHAAPRYGADPSI